MPPSPFVNPSSYGGNMFDSKIDVKMTMGGNSGAGNTKKHKSNKRSRRSIRLMKTKESKRFGKHNRFWLKNGGGKEDLIKQIGDIIDDIDSKQEATLHGTHWCQAQGPNICDSLEKQKETLIKKFELQFLN